MPLRTRRAFTLVELLVVIGIVSVLIALLMPALNRARSHARRIQCASNLRSMGQALTMYVHQYGYYPGCVGWAHTALPAIWPTRLRLFMGGNTKAFHCPERDAHFAWEPTVLPPLFHPISPHGQPQRWATDVMNGFGYVTGERVIMPWHEAFSYGYNGRGTRTSSIPTGRYPNVQTIPAGLGTFIGDTNGHNIERELRANRVKVASEMIAIADSKGDAWLDVLLSPSPTGQEWVGDIHERGANVLFCDGHVQWYLQRELHNHSAGDARTSHVRKLWNNDNLP
jgi:prepilin-type processing-associated H-X9-DG protein/prepilin-type N-terminal cleavage/methylation domain-containing protein